MGVVEVLKRFRFFRREFHLALEEIAEFEPDLLLLIDYPGFNLRLAKQVRERFPKVKVAHYVAPQVWAWNQGRIPQIAKSHDLLLCLFPFEVDIFEKAGVRAKWIGHPLVDELRDDKIDAAREEGLVGLFPGSREREIARLLPTMLGAGKLLKKTYRDAHFELACATPALLEQCEKLVQQSGVEGEVEISVGKGRALMQRASCGLVASGTATLEAGFYGLPYALLYALSPVTYEIGKRVVKIPHIGLINILAGREVVRELIQDEVSPTRVFPELERLFTSDLGRATLETELLQITRGLGEPGSHSRAAEFLRQLMVKGE